MGCGAGKAKYVAEVDRSPTLELERPGQASFCLCYETSRKIQDVYEPLSLPDHPIESLRNFRLADGRLGPVRRTKNVHTGYIRVIKTYTRKEMSKEQVDKFHEEVKIMNMLDLPGIVKLFAVFEEPANFYMILSHCGGGPLLKNIDASFGEKQAASVLKQLFQAVRYMHRLHVCHRDLRPENLLLGEVAPLEKCSIKVIDFACACLFETGRPITGKIGDHRYQAPQVCAMRYDQSCDLWSCGVSMFNLLSNKVPFKNGYGSVKRDYKLDYSFASSEAKDLIVQLLTFEQENRIDPKIAISHAWIERLAPRPPGIPLSATQLRSMVAYSEHSELKKMAMHVIARRLQDDEVGDLRHQFSSLDVNDDGMLTRNELKAAVGEKSVSRMPDVDDLLQSVDIHKTRGINYTEFVAATMDDKWLQNESLCWTAFRHFDKDGSGHITLENLKKIVVEDGELDAAVRSEKMLQDFDVTGNKEINFSEFVAILRNCDQQSLVEKWDKEKNAPKLAPGDRLQPPKTYRTSVEAQLIPADTLAGARRLSVQDHEDDARVASKDRAPSKSPNELAPSKSPRERPPSKSPRRGSKANN